MKKKPNIILLMTDRLRGDCLGYAGHPDVKTPYLDTLASRGIFFDHAYSACPSCIAARASLHTGMAQDHHRRVGYEDGIPWEYEHTLAGELTKAGYHTYCVGKMHVSPLRNYLGYTVDGRSMLPMVSDPSVTIRDALHCEHAYGDDSCQWIVTPEDKYIWYTVTGKEQYFRMDTDRRELRDEINNEKYASRIKWLRDILIRHLESRPEGFVSDGKLVPGREYRPYISF